jgi:hypothetical protein
MAKIAQRTNSKANTRKRTSRTTSGKDGPVTKLCKILGYSHEKPHPRNVAALRIATATHRKAWIEKRETQLDVDDQIEYNFPKEHWAPDVQQCVDDFLKDPKHKDFFRPTREALDADVPTLPHREELYVTLGTCITISKSI